MTKPLATEFFYAEKGKPRQDAALHDPILADGDAATARKISAAVARRLGLSTEQIAALYRQSRRKAMAFERAKARNLLGND